MKGDGEGKMNAMEKKCVVNVCSKPAIVGSSQSVTPLSRTFLFNFKNVTQFIRISPARDIVKRFSSGALLWPAGRITVCRNCLLYGPLLQQLVLARISLVGESLCSTG